MEMSGDPLRWHMCGTYNGIVGIPGEPSSNVQDQNSLPKSDEKINLKGKLPRDLIHVRLAHGDGSSSITIPIIVTVKLPD